MCHGIERIAGQRSRGAAHGMARASDDRSAPTAAQQLPPLGVPSTAVHAEPVGTEGLMRFAEYLELSSSQSAQGVGRAVAALAAHPDHLTLSGQIHEVTALTARCRIDISS